MQTNSRNTLLIIQIPCLDEARTLPLALAQLPRQVAGFDRVEWLVIDDGSTDDTAAVARACGVDHVVRFDRNRGLARAFMAGLDRALALGATCIVNTDADNQYDARDIPALTAPIRAGEADLVVGARPIVDHPHWSWPKKRLQRLGSRAMRLLSRTAVADAPSGFRALSREAALRSMVLSDYTYTMETLIHAGHQGLRVVNVPVRVNADLRPSRLFRSISAYVRRSLATMATFWLAYHAHQALYLVGGLLAVASAAIAAISAVEGGPFDALPATLLTTGGLCLVGAVLAQLQALDRRLLQDIRLHLRRHGLAPLAQRVDLCDGTHE